MKARFLLLAALLPGALLVSGVAGAYTVKPGDTLYSLARSSGLTVEALMRLNGLSTPELRVGQVIKLPGEGAATPAPVPAPAAPSPAKPAPTKPAPAKPAPAAPAKLPTVATAPNVLKLPGLTVTAPRSLKMGDGFVLRLTGEQAGNATVRFPSELGEDVRHPNEELRPLWSGEQYVVPGRVVLGKTTPVIYEVRLGGDVVRGQIPVTGLGQRTQHLNLPQSISRVLQDPAREAEDAAVEQAYLRRTPQQWQRPFAPALASGKATSSSFGQPRTYVQGGKVAYHYGTDYPAPTGTPVLAINDGTVVIAGRYPVRGGLVVIDHGAGVVSLYFHQSKVTAKAGQKVTRGQKVGEVGSTGLSAGPHLHLEVRVRGEGTNPAGWMGKVWP